MSQLGMLVWVGSIVGLVLVSGCQSTLRNQPSITYYNWGATDYTITEIATDAGKD